MKDKVIARCGKKIYIKDGEEVTKEEWIGESKIQEILDSGNINTMSKTGWPLYSDAMGVNPKDNQQAYEASVKLGVPTERDNLGRAKFESAGHRKKYCEAFGYYDRNAGYSDPQPKNITS